MGSQSVGVDDQKKTINSWLLIVLLTALLTGVTLLTSYQPIYANIPINIIIPIYVLTQLDTVLFEKVKLTTLLVMRVLIVITVLGIIPGNVFVTINLVFLGINILEATVSDFRKKKYFNAVTGLGLILTIFLLKGEWLEFYYRASSVQPLGTIFWIIAYTIWNWVFVTNEFSPSIALYHIGILSAPLIGMILNLDPGLWLMFRANSLTAGGNIQIAKKDYLEINLENESFAKFVEFTQKKNVQIVLMILNIGLLIGMAYLALS